MPLRIDGNVLALAPRMAMILASSTHLDFSRELIALKFASSIAAFGPFIVDDDLVSTGSVIFDMTCSTFCFFEGIQA